MRPTFADIIQTVARLSDVSPEEIAGRSRAFRVVKARGLTSYLAHEFAGMSYPEISMALSRLSHGTYRDGAVRTRREIAAASERLALLSAFNDELDQAEVAKVAV